MNRPSTLRSRKLKTMGEDSSELLTRTDTKSKQQHDTCRNFILTSDIKFSTTIKPFSQQMLRVAFRGSSRTLTRKDKSVPDFLMQPPLV